MNVFSDMLPREEAYWLQKLLGEVSATEFPLDFKRRGPIDDETGTAHFELTEDTERELRNVSGNKEGLLFAVLVAALKVCLHKYTGSEDILVGTTIHERYARMSSLNTLLVLRDRVSGAMTVKELLLAVKATLAEAYTHQKYPVGKILATRSQRSAEDLSPLINIFIILENINNRKHIESLAKDLAISFSLGESKIAATLAYRADLFERESIEAFIERYKLVLRAIISSPETRISDLPILTEAERHQILIEWNATASPYPDHCCVHEMFQQQAEARADAVALVHGDQQVTYADLNARANRLARRLRAAGIEAEEKVAICVERSLEMVIGLVGVLKAGGAYVPVDAGYPQERLTMMIEDASPKIILTKRHRSDQLAGHKAIIICIDEWESLERESAENLNVAIAPQNLCYVSYTSGSTGLPKGVSIPHRGVVRLVKDTNYMHFRSDEAFLQFAPLSFDASTFEIWGCLLNGARLAIMPSEFAGPEALGAAIVQHGVQTLWLTAGLFHLMVDQQLESLRWLRQLLAGGDVLSVAHVQKFLRSAGNCTLINGYGPTENTTFTCCYPMSASEPVGDSVPLGKPIANTQVYILDNDLQPVLTGTVGEIYIGGDGLARGYLNRPELTAMQFVPDPFSWQPGARLYRSGDLARFLPDGKVRFEGRRDNQVKVRGFRIELGEIEAALSRHESIGGCIALVREDMPGDKRLVAYVVPQTVSPPSASDLRKYLQQKLPDYMIPSAFVTVDSFPLTPNGKINRKALPAPGTESTKSDGEYRAPRDLLELRLTRIWEQVLRVRPVGVRDNFFDLGGHSILSVLLMDGIKNSLGIDLPMATLFRAATVEGLAAQVRQQGDPAIAFTSLVEIQPGGSGRPFFCVHPAGGNVLCYMDLARELGPQQSFYGFQSKGLAGGEAQHSRIESMAAHYLELLRQAQPQGPYLLGGWSIGGLVAFEMMQRLQVQGHQVPLLALFDTGTPSSHHRSKALDRLSLLAAFARDVGFPEEELRQAEEEWDRLDPDGQLNRILERAQAIGILPLGIDLRRVRTLFNIFVTNVNAASIYSPETCAGRVTLFRAAERMGASLPDHDGWNELANEVDVHIIPGDHFTMLRQPNVRILAQQLESCIENAASKDRAFSP